MYFYQNKTDEKFMRTVTLFYIFGIFLWLRSQLDSPICFCIQFIDAAYVIQLLENSTVHFRENEGEIAS